MYLAIRKLKKLLTWCLRLIEWFSTQVFKVLVFTG